MWATPGVCCVRSGECFRVLGPGFHYRAGKCGLINFTEGGRRSEPPVHPWAHPRGGHIYRPCRAQRARLRREKEISIFPPSPLESYVFFPFPPLPLRIEDPLAAWARVGWAPNRQRYYYNLLTVHTKAHLRFSTRRTRATRVYCPRWAFWLLCPRGIERPRGARCCARTRVGFTIFSPFLALGLPRWPADPKMLHFS